MKWMGWNPRSKVGFIFLATLMAACSSDGCSCDGFEQSPFPEAHYDKTFAKAAQVRLSPHGLRFLEGEVPNLIGDQLEGGLSFCVPPVDQSNIELCHTATTCTDGTTGCQLEFAIEETRLVPAAPNFLNVEVVIGDVLERLPIEINLLVTTRCWLHLYKRGDINAPATIKARVPIEFAIDNQSPTRDLQIKIDDIDVDLEDLDYRLTNRSGLGCGLVSGTVKLLADGILRGLIDDALSDQVVPTVQELVCQSCGDGEPACPNNATCRNVDGNQMCMYDATNECVPIKLGVEGKLVTNNLLGEYAQFEPASLDLMILGADEAVANTGLSLHFRGGFQPERFDRCAPVDPTTRPAFTGIATSPTIHGDVRPHNMEPFMFGIGVHKLLLDHAFWSAWAGGALCLKVGTETLDLLHTGTIGAVLPSVRALAESNAELYMIISPQNAPTVSFGENRVVQQGNNNVVEEGLLTLEMDDFDIHFYGFIMERFTRLFSLRSDVRLPVALVPDGEGSVVPALGDLNAALTNMRPMNYELLSDDPQRLIDLLPTLLGLALPSLMESLADPIELPDLVGYRLKIGPEDIRGVDGNTVLAIFADLERVPPAAYGVALTTLITNYAVELGRQTPSGVERPRVVLDVIGIDQSLAPVSMEEMEYSYRVGGGSWSLFGPGPRLEIDSPVFTLQGSHRIEVRARKVGEPASTQRAPTAMEVIVDYEAPTVSFDRIGTTVSLEGYDVVDKPGELLYRHRILSGAEVLSAWTPWTPQTEVELAGRDLPGRFTFEVEVKDRAGYVGTARRVMTLDLALEGSAPIAQSSAPAGGCGCASTSSGGPAEGLLWLAGLFGFLWLRRRRSSGSSTSRRSLLGLVALVALFGSAGCGGCGDDTAEAALCEPACPTNFVCDDGACVQATCTDDGECDEGICLDGVCTSGCRADTECGEDCADDEFGVCLGNECACQAYCKDGCSEDTFCCYESNSCQTYPNWCEGVTCDPGFEPVITNRGAPPTVGSCKAEGGTCECVSLPALPMGWYGLYSSLAVGGGVKAVSVHNRTYRDLMVGILDANNQPTWHWVDGVPAGGAITGDLQGPRGGISARGPRVGSHTALVIDESAQLHVFYHDIDNKALKYARGNAAGEFTMKLLDEDMDAGFWSSARLVDGQIHLVYVAYGEENLSQMRYVTFAADAAFDTLEVEPAVIYETTPVSVRAGPPGYRPATGLFNELTATADGLFLVFYDHTVENVAWMEMTETGWEAPQFLGAPSGPYVSGRKDSEGIVHLAYMDPSSSSLVYWRSDASPEVIIEGTRDTGDGWLINDIGESVRLRLRSNGAASVVFQDATRHMLYGAERSPAGEWTPTALSGGGPAFTGSHGFFASSTVSTAGFLIAEFVIDNQATPAVAYPVFYEVP